MLRSVLVVIINICNSTGRKSGRLEAIEAGEAAPDIPEDSDNLTSASKGKYIRFVLIYTNPQVKKVGFFKNIAF